MPALQTILLLLASNVFMTFAWYGHLRLQEAGVSSHWPLIRIGFIGNGGPFTLVQLKVIQEVISLTIFTVIIGFLFQGQSLHWNHIAAFVCLVLAVYFVFK